MWLTSQCLDHTRPSKLHQWSRIPGTCQCTHHVQNYGCWRIPSWSWHFWWLATWLSWLLRLKMTWSTTLHNIFDKNTVIKYVYWQNMWPCKSSAQYLLLFQSSSHLSVCRGTSVLLLVSVSLEFFFVAIECFIVGTANDNKVHIHVKLRNHYTWQT